MPLPPRSSLTPGSLPSEGLGEPSLPPPRPNSDLSPEQGEAGARAGVQPKLTTPGP